MSDTGDSQAPADGQIVTFYSFKGGTGRTMALANVAWILAANGKRVLVADWDLESPGLSKFFRPFLDEGAGEGPGIVDFIRRYEWAAAQADIDGGALEGGNEQAKKAALEAIDDLISEYIAVQDYAVPLQWRFPGTGTLEYLSPGKQRNGDYQATLSALAWDTFYDQLFGGMFFDALRASMKRHYDYVLIDSRTGLSDVADICTVHLPDTVVDCFTLSSQGIDGAAMIADMIKAHTHRELRILPVPMRIDDAEKEKAEAGQAYAAGKFGELPKGMSDEQRRAYWAAVGVPYRAWYAYEETLAVFGDAPGVPASLLSSFERITAEVTGDATTRLPPMEQSLRLRTRLRFGRREAPGTDEVILDFSPEDQLWAEWISAVLAGADIAVRYVDEASGREGTAETEPQILSIISESYIGRMQHSIPAFDPDLVISVTDARLPHQLDEVPVVFLAGLSEQSAAERLLGRLDAGRKGQPRTADVRYPGGSRLQILGFPARNDHFTGRQADLETLRGELRSRGMAVVLPVTIQGLGGVGKTQVALEYAHRFKADYDLIWWMDCGQSQYVDASLTDLGKELRGVFNANLPEEGSGPEIARQVLRLLRENPQNLRWLLVYDNADDIDAVRPLLPEGHGHVLITSRNEHWNDKGGTSLTINVFGRAESIRHLQLRVPEIPRQDAERVAEVLEDLPLAVATAGAWLADTHLSVDDYLRELKRQTARLSPDSALAFYPEPVAQTWELSFGRLEEISEAGAWLLGMCSVMAAEISLDLIYTQAMALALKSEQEIIGKLLRQIDRLALIKLDSNQGQISVHRVVQAMVKERMSEQIPALQDDVHQVLVAARPIGDVDNPDTWLRYRQIWPHLTPSAAMRSAHVPVRQLLIDRVRYLWQRGDLERGRRRATEIESAWESMLAAESEPAMAESLRKQLFRLKFNKANILRSLGEFGESLEIDEKVLEGQREMLGADHPHTLGTRSSLAADLRAMGEYRRALALDRVTYKSWASEYGEDYRGTLSAANNLAISLRLTGDFQSALVQDKLTFERRSVTLGPLHPRTLDSGVAVARDLLEAGRYGEVVSQMRGIWAQCREALGESDRATLNARLLLGVALRCAGDAEHAQDHIEEARRGLTRGFGSDSSDTLSCRLSQALNLLAINHVAEAKNAAQQVLAVYEARLGPDHPHSLICRLNIATALCLEEAYPAALEMAQAAVEGLEQRLDPDDPYTLAAKMVVGAILASQERLTEAEQIEEEVLAKRTRILGPQHPDTLRSRVNLLLTRRQRGVRGASAEREAVINELKLTLGQEHADIGTAIRDGRMLSAIDPQPF